MLSSSYTPAQQSELFEQAFALHESGRLSEAAELYKKLLLACPKDSELLAGLGTVALQQGRFAEAIELLGQSLAGDPAQECILTNRGLAYAQLQQSVEALSCYELAIALDPSYPDAYFNRGNVLKDLQRFDEALASYDKALELQPHFAAAHINRGIARQDLQQYAAALDNFQQALALAPDDVSALNNCGMALRSLQRFEEALACFDKALVLNPQLPEAYNNRGVTLLGMQRFAQALLDFDKGIALKPALADLHKNRSLALLSLQRFDEALQSIEQALALSPGLAELYDQRGAVLLAMNQFAAAFRSFDQALSLKPQAAQDFWNLAMLKIKQGLYAEALQDLDTVLELQPELVDAYVDRGNALKDTQQLEAALRDFDLAIALDSDCSKAYWSKAALLLLRGDYAAGWPLFEWRWAYTPHTRLKTLTQPLWLGGPELAGKTVLLHPEQGLGDFIQFCRYAPLVSSLGGKALLEAPPALAGLMASLPGDVTVIKHGEALPPFDLHCPIMSLPLAFLTDLETVPQHMPYLSVDPEKSRIWRARLGEKSRLRVGLVWSGSTGHSNDHLRSLPLALLEPLWRLPIEFHALQKEYRPADAELLGQIAPLQSHAELLQDFSDTAALLDNLDLLISVDTSVAHLAGALAKPVWVLLQYAPDFRWMLDRSDTPWYPSARLFRQPAYGDWAGVIADVSESLARAVAESR